jgi:hypothetical protein
VRPLSPPRFASAAAVLVPCLLLAAAAPAAADIPYAWSGSEQCQPLLNCSITLYHDIQIYNCDSFGCLVVHTCFIAHFDGVLLAAAHAACTGTRDLQCGPWAVGGSENWCDGASSVPVRLPWGACPQYTIAGYGEAVDATPPVADTNPPFSACV